MHAKVMSRWPAPNAEARATSANTPIKAGAKKVASKGLDATGPAIGVGTTASGTGAVAMATGAAAASATGIALVVVGGLATLGAAAKSAVAASSSREHRDALEKIHGRWQQLRCLLPRGVEGEVDINAHQRIAHNVLPYAIQQKNKKYNRKWYGAIPVLGTLPMAVRQAYRAATKDDRGVERKKMAYELAVHLITHDCALAQEIVAELFSSYEKTLWMLRQDTTVLTPLIEEKLKSV